MNRVSSSVKSHYDDTGWVVNESGVTQDADNAEDLRSFIQPYISRCRLRVGRFIKPGGCILEVGCGPLQYKEYLSFYERAQSITVVDVSDRAIKTLADRKIENLNAIQGDILTYETEEKFDYILLQHVLYHIDKKEQLNLIKKLTNILKPGGNVVVVYSNVNYFISVLFFPVRKIKHIFQAGLRRLRAEDNPLYFERLSVGRFKTLAKEIGVDFEMYPWRTFPKQHQQVIFHKRFFGVRLLNFLAVLEESYPRFMSYIGQYPILIFTKK